MIEDGSSAARPIVPSRVTSVRAFPGASLSPEQLDYLFVRVESSSGTVGFGEVCDSYGCRSPILLQRLVENVLAPLVIGEDVEHPARLMQKVRSGTRRAFGDRGSVVQAISGVEMALWDLLGRLGAVSVAQMFGQVRDRIPIYVSNVTLDAATAPEHVEFLAPWLARGVSAVKVRIGNDLVRDLDTLEALRELLGEGIEIMADANGRYLWPAAESVARDLAAMNVRWLEEPVPWAPLDPVAARSDRDIPFAYGERLSGVDDVLAFGESGIGMVLQPDASVGGGIREARISSLLIEPYGHRVVPHSAAGPVAFAANVHLAASTPSIALMEYPVKASAFWRRVGAPPEILPEGIIDGCIEVPARPGLGVELDIEEIRADAMAVDPVRRHEPLGSAAL